MTDKFLEVLDSLAISWTVFAVWLMFVVGGWAIGAFGGLFAGFGVFKKG